MPNQYETSAYAHAAHNGQDPVQLALQCGGDLSDSDHAFFKDYLLATQPSGLHEVMDFTDGVVKVGLYMFGILLVLFFVVVIYLAWSSL